VLTSSEPAHALSVLDLSAFQVGQGQVVRSLAVDAGVPTKLGLAARSPGPSGLSAATHYGAAGRSVGAAGVPTE